ncbi:hypothetical protein BKP42_03360 [Rhodococcus erythropolis]|nr:hypothetical protein BKP42_03360 [Rhodococcus erythropolis]
MPDAHDVCRVVERKVVEQKICRPQVVDGRFSAIDFRCFAAFGVQGRLSALALSLSRVAVEPAVLSSIPSRTFLPIDVSLGSAIG